MVFQSILSEIEIERCDQFRVNGTLAYVSQEVFCLNATIRDNILFGHAFDQKKYDTVLQCCALNQDLMSLCDGDQTMVGESGFTLSGGQKARISLAR